MSKLFKRHSKWPTQLNGGLSKRSFLKKGSIATVGLLLIACGSGKKTSKDKTSGSQKDGSTSGNGPVMAIVSADLIVNDVTQRLAFAIMDKFQPQNVGNLNVDVLTPSGKKSSYKAKYQDSGIKNKGIYTVQILLNEKGNYKIEANNESAKFGSNIITKDAPFAPYIGDKAIEVSTPTLKDTQGVDPICTQKPTCSHHSVDLKETLGSKPTVILFATPARCQTAYCGNVLDSAIKVSKKYATIEFIHNEIYKNLTTNEVIDSVKAWDLPSEPWIFAINKDKKVTARLDGAFTENEINELFKTLQN